jgi:hypothetical protein
VSHTIAQTGGIYHILSELSDETLLIPIAKRKGEIVKRQISALLTTYQHVKPILTGSDLKPWVSNRSLNSKEFLIDCWIPGSMAR